MSQNKIDTLPSFRHNVLFLLSAAGKFNYQGSKRWLEDAQEASGAADSSTALLNSAKLVLCLDSLAATSANSLRMHVSKPPSPGTVASALHTSIEKVRNTVVITIRWYLMLAQAVDQFINYTRVFLRKMLGTRCEPVGTRFL